MSLISFHLRIRVFVAAIAAVLAAASARPLEAQLVTVGAGALVSDRPTEPVAELHAAAPAVEGVRPYLTLSWTDESVSPTAITAAERSILQTPVSATGLGAGLLWLDANDYRPYPMLVSSTVVPLPLPRTSMVAVGSTLPFEDFEWSLVLKIGVAVLTPD